MKSGARKRAGQRGKSIEEVVGYAVSHKTRVQILILLNQGTYSPTEIAGMIDEPLNKVSNHLTELADAGSIEVAETKWRRNFRQNFYRAVEIPIYTKEDMIAMTPLERQVTFGLVIQSLLAEIMAALWAGKMRNDPDMVVAWDPLNVDRQGRCEVNEELEGLWKRLARIEEESLNRAAVSGEETTSYMAAVLGFERARRTPQTRRSTTRG